MNSATNTKANLFLFFSCFFLLGRDLFIFQSRPQIFDISFALTTKGLSEEQKKGRLPVESLAELEIGGLLVLETQWQWMPGLGRFTSPQTPLALRVGSGTTHTSSEPGLPKAW